MADHNKLLKYAIHAAIKAGEEIISVYDSAHEVELKSDKSPLTIADKKAHNKIVELLSESGLPVLSEEGRDIPYEERTGWESFWMVDPLDGTREFIKKNGEFTVNIALIENQKSVLGVIYVPVTDTLYFGATWIPSCMQHHASAFFHSEKNPDAWYENMLAVSLKLPVSDSNHPYTVVASRSHLSPETELFIETLRVKHGELEFISSGSSIKICLVAEGSADIYPRLAPTMEWDTAAGQAIAENAGCIVTNFHTGLAVTYNKADLLNPHFVVQRP